MGLLLPHNTHPYTRIIILKQEETTAQADSYPRSANEHRLFILLPVGSNAAVKGVLPDHRLIKLHNSVYNDPLKQCW
jgi:hypothetical protein